MREDTLMMPTRACAVFSLGLAAFIGSAPVIAQSGKATPPVIQSQDTNVTGVVAELTECKRKDGVLTVKVRLHNTSSAKVDFKVIEGRNYAKFYVTAENKKYFILTDSEKAPLTTQADMFGGLDASITPGGSYQWWAKYPAPPPSVKTLTLYTPWTPSFDDVPITGE